MINDKKSFFLGNLLGAGVVGMIVVACGGGGGDANTGVSGGANSISGATSVSARQVIFTDSSGNYVARIRGTFVKVATTATSIDTTTQVLAKNVNLDTSGNTVVESNLQDALDKQIALDLTRALPGITWVITNTASPDYIGGNESGVVTFNSDGSFTMQSGNFCAAGARTQSSTSKYPGINLDYMTSGSGTFKVIGENSIAMSFPVSGGGRSPGQTAFYVLSVVSKSMRQITVVTDQCISVLTPAPSTAS